jgi:hypothetical protein
MDIVRMGSSKLPVDIQLGIVAGIEELGTLISKTHC